MTDREPLSERLRYIRSLQAEQDEKRRSQKTCPHDHDRVELVRRAANGARHVYRGCGDCGRPCDGGTWLPGREDADGLPLGGDDRYLRPPCARCGAFGTELHHFAPRALFGKDEAELWPTAYLCVDCHQLWHRTMEAGTQRRPGAA